MAPWEPDLEHFRTELDGEPVRITVDLAALAHRPVATHPRLLTVRVPVRGGDDLDAPAQVATALAIAAEVQRRVEALAPLFVGHRAAPDHVVCYLYLPDDAELDDEVTEPPVAGAAASWRLVDDRGWERIEALGPDPLAEQTLCNRRLLRMFEERGDDLAVPRELDHLAYFAARTTAERAAMDLRAAGFRVDDPDEVDDGDAWALRFHREDTLGDGRADDVVAEIFAILTRHAGRYDGWGAEQRPRPPR